MKKLLLIICLVIFGQVLSTAQKVARSVDRPTPTELEYRAYAVRLYAVQKLPVVNPALLPWDATVVWHKYPTDWAEIEQLVTLPDFLRRRGYRICKDCPLEVLLIKPLP